MFKTKVTRNKRVGKSNEKVIHISKSNDGLLSEKDIKNLYEAAKNQHKNAKHKDKRFLIRAMGKDKIYTFKGYHDNNLNIKSQKDYLEGKVEDPDAVSGFLSMEIQIAYDLE